MIYLIKRCIDQEGGYLEGTRLLDKMSSWTALLIKASHRE